MKLGKATLITTSQATEDMKKVEKALALFLPHNITPSIRKYEGYYGNLIHLLKVELEKSRDVNTFLRILRECMSEHTRASLRDEIPERMDDDCVLHLRFDKQRALFGETVLTRSPDCIVVSMKVLTYPKSREEAIKRAREMLCE